VGYHDRQKPDYMNTGIAVVNPLHEQQRRLNQLEKLLNEIAEETSDRNLREKILNVLK